MFEREVQCVLASRDRETRSTRIPVACTRGYIYIYIYARAQANTLRRSTRKSRKGTCEPYILPLSRARKKRWITVGRCRRVQAKVRDVDFLARVGKGEPLSWCAISRLSRKGRRDTVACFPLCRTCVTRFQGKLVVIRVLFASVSGFRSPGEGYAFYDYAHTEKNKQ